MVSLQLSRAKKDTGIDCDGDGESDLILTGQHQAMVMALSGKDGSLLWNNLSESEETRPYGKGTIVGPPLFRDLNADDVPDVIGCFATHDPSSEKTECRLRAVSGSDGKQLWEYQIDAKLHAMPRAMPYPPYMARWYPGQRHDSGLDSPHIGFGGVAGIDSTNESQQESDGVIVPYPPQFVPGTNKKTILLCVADTLLQLNSETGDVETQDTLSGIPVRSPQWVDAGADGTFELLICTRNLPPPNVSSVSVTQNPALHLELWDLKNLASKRSIWQNDIVANWEWSLPWNVIAKRSRDWPLIDDLDGDGQHEIVLAAASTAGESVYRVDPTGRMQVLDVADGR